MASVTVTPDTLELALTQQPVTLPGATHVQYASAFALALTLPAPKTVCSFPIISRKPSQVFSDELSDKAVLVKEVASGYPQLNKLFTFDARTFIFDMPAVPEADKVTIMAFYEAHKDEAFPWYNKQVHEWFEVVFIRRPGCKLQGRGDLWNLRIMLRQNSP